MILCVIILNNPISSEILSCDVSVDSLYLRTLKVVVLYKPGEGGKVQTTADKQAFLRRRKEELSLFFLLKIKYLSQTVAL